MLFEKLYSCSDKDPRSQFSAERIIRVSKQYGDDLHIELEQQQKIVGNTKSVLVYRKCVATRKQFRKFCMKKHEVQVLKIS